jgi:hypothetical protein
MLEPWGGLANASSIFKLFQDYRNIMLHHKFNPLIINPRFSSLKVLPWTRHFHELLKT